MGFDKIVFITKVLGTTKNKAADRDNFWLCCLENYNLKAYFNYDKNH